MSREQWLRLSPLLMMLLFTTLVAMGLFTDNSKRKASRLEGLLLPSFETPLIGSATGAKRFDSKTWKGNVVVLNVFASWCEPCAVEHPALMALAKTGKVNIVGLAWKDEQQKVIDYLTKHGNPFQLVGLDTMGSTTATLGLTGVPETFVLDMNGRVIYSNKQPITEEEVNSVILPIIREAQGKS